MKQLIKGLPVSAAFVALLVIPATASAINDPLVTWPTGTKLAVAHGAPAQAVGTSTGGLVITDANTSPHGTCSEASLNLNLETNTGTGAGTGTVEGTITSLEMTGPAGGNCVVNGWGPTKVTIDPGNGMPWCMRASNAMVTQQVQIRGDSCTRASRPITFIFHMGDILTCNYVRNFPLVGTYKTHPEQAALHLSHQEVTRETGNAFLCPTSYFLDISFALEIEGKPLYIDNQ